ncbi:hypothetical protein HanIR_Chr03g0120311 [Helianthus annuus]|nr:hypothetical protein HanIR_Chr03g0120311 [Helianthus annuus]
MEENIHEHNVTWVDTRASEAYIPACIRKLTWNCCRKLLEARKRVKCMGSALSLTRVS